MPRATTPSAEIGLAELVSALSHALDITEGQPQGHSVRCCWIGMHIGERIGLDAETMADLYYTLLLKDVGCSSNAARLCQLYLADDLRVKRDFKLVDDSLSQLLGFILSHAGMKANLAERFRSIVHMARNGGELANELIETRCQRGADIARQMRFSDGVAQGILDLDEHWNGKGRPLGLAGEAISLHARIALMAQVIDVFAASGGPKAAMREVRQRSGTWFDPTLCVAFDRVAADPGFWAGLLDPDLEARVIALEPVRRVMSVDDDYLDDIAAGFARVIDAKSPFTGGHSDRVALFADIIAEELGFTADRRRWLKRAALLHDIGKLGVSNQILDKPGKLDSGEWVEMRAHAALGEQILSRVAAFADLARVAGAHHERLDGTGYPHGLEGDRIDLETRIIAAADIFDALTADRPYRAAMTPATAFGIMREEAVSKIDPGCLAALEQGFARAA